MVDPFNTAKATAQGRIRPQNFTADQTWSMSMGYDIPGKFALLKAGDKLVVSQTGDFDTSDLVKITARLRPPVRMPNLVRVDTPAATGTYTVTLNGTDFDYSATVGPDTETKIGSELVALVNAGDEPISGQYQGDPGSNAAYLAFTPDDPDDAYTIAVSANMTTAPVYWRFSLLIDSVERAYQLVTPGNTRDRVELAANVAALSGDHDLEFQLGLTCTISGPVEVELPGVYIDPVIFA